MSGNLPEASQRLDLLSSAPPQRDLTAELQKRLRFIEGQARGVQGMLGDGRELTDVLTQLRAIQSAAGAAATLIVQERMIGRIKDQLSEVLQSCAGSCDSCNQLEDVMVALDRLDYASLVEELVDARRANGARPKA
jgi:DNA-binding FrmR family transcriptional regulator